MNMPLVLLNRRRRGNVFTPSGLFALAEPGVWYDPSDLTTLFTDTAGTTPVTTPGQTVALALDKSKGLVLGSELRGAGTTGLSGTATAATYNTGTGVGTASRVDSGNQSYVSFGSTVANNFYLFSIQNTGASNLVIRINNSGGTVLQVVNAGASFAGYVTGGTALVVTAQNNGTTASFTVISVKELPGNHATQATAASRPTYGIVPATGRRNLLTFTEQFDNAAWTKTAATVTANAGTAPDGSTTADRIVETSATSSHLVLQAQTSTSGISHVFSVYMKADTRSWGVIYPENTSGSGAGVWFNLSTGTVGTQGSGRTGSITSVGNGWYRCVVIATLSTAGQRFYFGPASADNTLSYTGDGTSGILIWGAQLETGSTATAYQRVGAPSAVSGLSFDVTEAGVQSLSYLWFDGVDDFLVTPTITPGIDKAQVFAGVRKLSDAAIGVVAEFSADSTTNNGSIGLFAPAATSGPDAQRISGFVRGTAVEFYRPASAYAAPTTRVATLLADIAGSRSLRLDGVAVDTRTTVQSSNFLAYPLFIGRRGGSTFPFNGHLYSMIVRFGANLDANTITNTETWVNGRTGAF